MLSRCLVEEASAASLITLARGRRMAENAVRAALGEEHRRATKTANVWEENVFVTFSLF